jgi:hypothetical protein
VFRVISPSPQKLLENTIAQDYLAQYVIIIAQTVVFAKMVHASMKKATTPIYLKLCL